jgi:hypothetical protein
VRGGAGAAGRRAGREVGGELALERTVAAIGVAGRARSARSAATSRSGTRSAVIAVHRALELARSTPTIAAIVIAAVVIFNLALAEDAPRKRRR